MNPQLESRTPVTVLTGFLGSGKTTLLNRILAGASGIRFGVLVNDFGELNIDARLVSAVDGNAIDLSNGCVCCTMQGGLVTGVRKMLSRARPPEHIIVEASGIADPLGIVSAFHTPALAECAALDAVVGVVDVEHVRSPRLDRQVVEDQIRAADLIVLNKTDLVLERARCETRDWLRSIVPDVRVLEAQQADIPLEALFGGELRKVGEKPHSRTYDAHLLQSWSYESDRPLAYRCVRTALEEMPDGIFRAKGFLYLADAPNLRFVVHRVGRRLGIDVHGPWADERRASAIVLLGEPDAVTVERIVALFDDCTTDAFPLLQPENFKRLTGRAYDRAV